MNRTMTSTMLGLAIIAGALALARPATAETTAWYNAKNPSMYLSVAGGISCPIGHGGCWLNDGQNIIVWNTGGSLTPDQHWYSSVNATGTVVNNYRDQIGRNLCLGVAGGSSAPGTVLVVWPCEGQPDQEWRIDPATSHGQNYPGCYVFINNRAGTQQAMGVANGQVSQGGRVVIWPLGIRGAANLDMVWCPR